MISEARLDTTRIDYLISDAALHDVKIVLVGLGSGGAVVLERLGMCSIGHWSLYDPEILEPVNLVKHPARRADIGRAKTDIAREWLIDRNPGCTIHRIGGNVMTDEGFSADIADADIVVCAVDSPAARSFTNEACVRQGVPCIFGSVFRTGLGGEVYAYLPGESGCFDCKGRYSLEQGLDIENYLDLTDDEVVKIYGVGESEFTASGLAADISIVASYHAHYIISLLAGHKSVYLSVPSFNWLTVSLRRVEGMFNTMYETSRMLLRPQSTCHLRCSVKRSVA